MKDADQNPNTVPAPIDPMAYYFQDVLLLNKPQAVRLYLIRHGQSASNEARELGKAGEHDPPLTAVGEEQARRLGERMAAYGVDVIYSSPLQRAYNTGAAIARITNHEIVVVDDLQEINEPMKGTMGPDPQAALPAGVTHRDVKAKFEADPVWDNLPGSENSAHFRTRIVRAIDGIIAANAGKKVAITCHGGVIQSYVAHILGLRTDFPFYCFNASITSVRAHEDRRALWRLNDLGHLEGTRIT